VALKLRIACSANTMVTKRNRLKRIAKPDDCPIVGVAITITRHRNSHAGIVFRDTQDRVRLLHLAFHHDLKYESFNGAEYLCADPEFEHEDAEIVAAHCRLIASIAPNTPTAYIKFAIHYNPAARIRVQGQTITVEHEGKGLNCSTFILTVFARAGPSLIDFTTWRTRESDAKWHRYLVNLLKRCAPEPHWKKVEQDIGCARVRPEEVAGACLEDPVPANFDQCEANGVFALGEVAKHVRRTSVW
jgi:hypothetical protein